MPEKAAPSRRTFTIEIKQQLVDLDRSGKSEHDIIRKYAIASTLLNKWIAQLDNSDSFKWKDNHTEQQKFIELHRQNLQFRMENDILKQAALILRRG